MIIRYGDTIEPSSLKKHSIIPTATVKIDIYFIFSPDKGFSRP